MNLANKLEKLQRGMPNSTKMLHSSKGHRIVNRDGHEFCNTPPTRGLQV